MPYLTSGAALVFEGPLRDTNGTLKYLETDILTDAEIASMNWYVEGVEVVGDFRDPNYNVSSGDMEIKY